MLALAAGHCYVERAAAALAGEKLKHAPRTREGGGDIPWAENHENAAHGLDGI